jgi:hypothetical protein
MSAVIKQVWGLWRWDDRSTSGQGHVLSDGGMDSRLTMYPEELSRIVVSLLMRCCGIRSVMRGVSRDEGLNRWRSRW